MNNLGLYQKMTTWSKALKGPEKFMACLMIGGYAMGKTIELVGKQAVKKVKARKTDKNSDKIFDVKENGISNEGLVLAPGDKYRILEKDKDSILIEKIGDNNNPYFVDADLLKNVTE